MVKPHEIENPVESAAVDAVRALLEHVPNIQIIGVRHELQLESGHRLDARIDLDHDESRYALVMEIKPNGAPRFARSAVYQLESYIAHLRRSERQDDVRQLIPMLVSPYLSPESRSICLDHNVAYLDLYGNAHLAFGSVYIERTVRTDRSPKPARSGHCSPRGRARSCGFSCATRPAPGASRIWPRQPTPASGM